MSDIAAERADPNMERKNSRLISMYNLLINSNKADQNVTAVTNSADE
jgi:hypothetical protein